jgi:ABC-type polysaccharide/polyol phosphate export permease
VAPIWEVLVQAWFYCTPIMYVASRYSDAKTVEKFGSGLVHIAMINPAAMLLTQMGHAFIGGPAFPSAPAVGGWAATIAAGAIIVVMFALGWWFFTREAPRVAENL